MPTFQNMRRGSGSPGIVAIPGREFGAAQSNSVLSGVSKPFRSRSFSTYSASISGITKDSTGAALGGVTVQLFRTYDDNIRSQVDSDGAGNYVLYPDVTGPFFVVAYKIGSPDLAGTTVNTLLPA